MKKLIIEGKHELSGTIKIGGAKNSVVALIPAAMLTDGKCVIYNVPDISDVHRLIEILERLVEGGNSIVIIEHNLDVIKTADYIIDLGPEGGIGGGTVIATGTPEQIVKNEASYTGKFLKKYLK